jgi:hypothetical protein
MPQTLRKRGICCWDNYQDEWAVTAEDGFPAGVRTWRASAGFRISLIALQGMALALPAGFAWLTLWTNQVRAEASLWIVLAVAVPVWAMLAFRALTVRATLTPDALEIRNVFATDRILLVDITAVGWRNRRRELTVTERRPPSTVPASVRAMTYPKGRHQDPGQRYRVTAIQLGVLAAESGRRSRADEAADAIAAAAGLPPLPPRRPATSRRQIQVLVAVCGAMVGAGAVLSALHQGYAHSAGRPLTIIGVVSLSRPLLAGLGRLLARRRT